MPTLIYDATAHPLLDPAVLSLSGVARQELNAVAEGMLGLVGTQYTDDKYFMAARAVAYQMNYIVELGTRGTVLSAESTAEMSKQFRSNSAGMGVRMISPFAKTVISQLSGWATGVRSLRNDDDTGIL